MADQPDVPDQTAHFADALFQQALRRYLPADTATTLCRTDCPERLLFETFAQLASARYTISTYLPRHLVVRQLATTATGPWIEWVEGSLLFADVSGSTALAERLSVLGREGTEIVTGTLNAFFDALIQVIAAAGGDLLTFGGDALLVLFRGPQHAHIATRAALDLLATCGDDPKGRAQFQRTLPGLGTFSLSMHIGVESGRVALISAGQPESLHYSAMGRTVNSVARAEGYGQRGELVVGSGTWAQIAADADGVAVAAGYVRVDTLHTRNLPPARLPEEPVVTEPPEQAIPLIVQQLDRLTPYLPAGLLSRILSDPQRPRVEADLRPVTVLFAQIIGLGSLVEALDLERAALLLDTLLRPMQAAIERFGGVLNKLDLAEEGDKLLAIFGAPIAYEDHAERAARAALAMFTTEIPEDPLVQSLIPDPHTRIQMRIGLNTGSVFAGNVGTATRKEYTVMGDAVNVAARVMTQTPWGEIWCSAATAAQIAARLECEDRGPVTVRGKSEPLQLLRLLGEREQSPALEADAAPLVGRQAELDWLHTHLAATMAGQGRVLRISGAAGVGKSRLALALVAAARAAGMQVFHVNCLSYANNIPYAPWSEWLKARCAIESGDPADIRATKVSARLNALGSDARTWLPLLADLVRIDIADNLVTRTLDPQQRQERRFALFTDLLRVAAGGQPQEHEPVAGAPAPILLVFEDLHWADQVSLDLWRHIAARITDLPVLLLGVHRPQLTWQDAGEAQSAQSDLPDSQEPDGAHRLTLGELALPDCEALIAARLDAMQIPTTLREQIVARADGNPLFLEELLRMVIGQEQQRVYGQPPTDEPRLVRAALDELPESLHGLLLARIDQLAENSRTVLLVASVIGQRFPFGVLQSIHPHDEQTLLYQLGILDAQEFTLLEREVPERVHFFRHTLVQEVAYQSLLYARRRELHRKIGEYLEKRHTADLKPYYGLLAHHYRLSDSREKAITYLLRAGHAARDTYANDEAIQYYRWALETLQANPTAPQTWEVRKALGDVFSTVGRYDEALAEYAAILAVEEAPAEQTPFTLPPAVAAEALRGRGYALEKQGQYSQAIAELRQAEAVALTHPDAVSPLLVAAIYADMGLVLMRWGEYDRALEVCNAGLQHLRPDQWTREDERIEAGLHTQLGTIHGMRGDYPQARAHFERALAAQEDIDDLYGCSRSHNNLGYLWQLQGEYQGAIEHYAQAEELARNINARYILSSAQLNLAYAYYCIGMYDRAEANCRTAIKLCQDMRDKAGLAHIYDLFGMIAFNRGNYDRALHSSYEKALALHQELGSSYQEGNTLTHMANAYNALSQPAHARVLADRAGEIAGRVQGPQLQVEVLHALAEADLLSAAAPDEADRTGLTPAELLARSAEHARQASALAADIGSKLDQGVALRLLGQAAACQGLPYVEHFQASLAIFAEIKNRFECARTQARYAEALAGTNFSAAAAYLNQARETFIEIGAQGELARLSNFNFSEKSQ